MGHSGANLGPSLDHLGAILGRLGPSWGILGQSWGHLGPSWGHLAPSSGHLGPSWGHLVDILSHLGAKVGSGRVLPYCLQTLGPTSDPKLQTELVLHKIWGAAACPPQAFSIRPLPGFSLGAVSGFFCLTRLSQSVLVCLKTTEFSPRTPAHSAGPGGFLLVPAIFVRL